MVFFTCNHCGESLKKPAVEKHYTWKACKNAPPFLTCVDCLKDFRGDEFRAHTKCITEDEKYSAKGFVAKPERNKGAQKQEAWTEIIQNHLTVATDLDAWTRTKLERVAAQTNIPRKKAKFINFISNSMRISPNDALKIWSIIEKALEEFNKKADAEKAIAAANRKAADDEKAAKKAAEEAAKNNGETNGAAKVVKEKKSKKSKKANADSEVTSTTGDAAAAQPAEQNGKSKKSKKRKLEHGEADAALTNGDAKKAKSADGEEEATTTGAASFEWKKEITEALTKKSAGLKLEKLRKKVLKRFAAVTGAAESPKDEKKFQKHLDKLSKYVSVDGETVKLLVTA